MQHTAQRWGLGAAGGAVLGLIGGNFLLGNQSAALALSLSQRFGSTWFFHDLLAGSLSPLGAIWGLIFGFVLIDLPYLCWRQWHRDALHDAFTKVQSAPALQDALCAVAGSMASVSTHINLNQRARFFSMLLRAGIAVQDETVLCRCEAAFWHAARRGEVPDGALRCLQGLRPERERQALCGWLSARLLDLAFADFELSYAEEGRFWLIVKQLSLMQPDVESMLQLRLSALSDYRPTLRERLLAQAPWPDPTAAEVADDAAQPSDFSSYTQAPFDEAAALQAAREARTQGRELTLSEAYNVLGLPYGAPAGAVKKRYRQLMFKYHPDHFTQSSAAERERASLICLEIKLACELILGA